MFVVVLLFLWGNDMFVCGIIVTPRIVLLMNGIGGMYFDMYGKGER